MVRRANAARSKRWTWAITLAFAGGCGGAGGGIGAVNTMPANATGKAMSQAENCDDGDMKACTWIGIWFMVGGAGKQRSYEGRRFLHHACKNDYAAACKLITALNRPKAPATAAAPTQPAPPVAPATSDTGTGSASGDTAGAGACERDLPGSAPEELRAAAGRCDNGNLTACREVAVWLLKGNGGKEKIIVGLRWLKHACDRGDETSCNLIEEIKRKLKERQDQQQQQPESPASGDGVSI